MRKIAFCPSLLILLFLAVPTHAQGTATAVNFLSVEIWPDYDQPAVLILLTGTLPDDTPLPTTLTLPLPAAAQLNAVARIDNDNVLTDDIVYSQNANGITFTTPDLRFRLEYYVPYASEENGRFYTFTWQSPLFVAQTAVTVQQPAAASEMRLEPTAVNSSSDHGDGLTYHNLPSVTIPPNASYTVQLHYTMTAPRLTVETSTQPATTNTPTIPNTYFLLAAASATFVIIYVGWHYIKQRQHKQQPDRQPHTFCHNCGTPASPSDTFCRQCATRLKK